MASLKWTFFMDNGQVFLDINGKKSIVKKLTIGSKLHMMKVLQEEKDIPVELDLTCFKYNDNTFSEKFKDCSRSRTKFFGKWKEIRNEQQHGDEETSRKDDCFGESDLLMDDDESESIIPIPSLQTIQTLGDIKAEELKENELGVFDVHLDNLMPSSKQNEVRSISYEHVKDLEKSFMENRMSQLTILVGMVVGGEVERFSSNEFVTSGGTQVEIIGGNHTVCALKRISSRGMCPSTVKVRVYKPLSRVNALAVGLRHNLVHERTRPMTFLETVKLIRQLRCGDEISTSETRKWKMTIQSLFGDKTMKQLEGRLQNHIALARCSDSVFECILRAQDERELEINQTFFKNMMHFPSQYQLTCVEVLCKDGIKSYRQKVQEGLVLYPKQKRMNKVCKQTLNEQPVIGETTCENNDDDNNDNIQEITEPNSIDEIASLKRELSDAKQALKECQINHQEEIALLKAELSDERKKRKHTQSNLIETGAPVKAKWSDGVLYPAHVEKVETYYHVVFDEDRIKKRLKMDSIVV